MSDDLTKWGENVQRKMFEMWREHFKDYSKGVQPFTSPLPQDADVICVGYNPGALKSTKRPTKETKRFREGDFSLPENGDYAPGRSDYDTAENLRKYIFKDHLSYLDGQSIETNLYHLRGSQSDDHDKIQNKVAGEVWEDYEQFCVNTFLDLIQKVQPKVIVMFALGTYYNHRINTRVSEKDIYEVEGEGAKNALIVGEMSDIPVIITPHISKNRFYYEGSAIKNVVETKGPEVLSRHLS